MEEDDDDFYSGVQQVAEEADETFAPTGADAVVENEQMDTGEQLDEDDEEDEDDIQFTLEKPEGAKAEPAARPPIRSTPSQQAHDPSQPIEPSPLKSSTPSRPTESVRPPSTAPPTATVKGTLTHAGKPGSSFPAVRTSTLDVDATPIWPGTDRPLTSLFIDADFAEQSKAWRLPGTDQTDYFNYGFDEFTWSQYCMRQNTMGNVVTGLKTEEANFKTLFGGDGGGVGAPPGMPPSGPGGGMPGMPGVQDMEQMMQQMMASGMNPQHMDFGQFVQMAMPGMGPGSQNQGGPQQHGNQFGGGQGGFGSGHESVSPAPGAGQGFQPPTGPQQGAFGIDGYSAQQMAIMQNEQGGMGGGRGRGRRGRGFY